ncbi:MAG: biotin transporter BioY [Flavobacteriales bacterium]|nr:biotin transporter BioY [Flavobacteriales bacterium]
MLNQYIRFHQRNAVDMLIKVLISCVLLYFLGPIVISMQENMPVTLQSLVILFSAIAFGWRVGLVSTVLYLIAGGMGLPVFAGYKGGWQAFGSIYAGFFFGFLAASLISGYLTELAAFRKTIPSILNWFIGHLIILAFGAIWMIRLDLPEWQDNIEKVIPGAIIKSVIGALVIDLIVRFMTRGPRKQAFVD